MMLHRYRASHTEAESREFIFVAINAAAVDSPAFPEEQSPCRAQGIIRENR
jgi:hypothetical protein